jgi:hypothetical protein
MFVNMFHLFSSSYWPKRILADGNLTPNEEEAGKKFNYHDTGLLLERTLL